jgi:hypothetical protein
MNEYEGHWIMTFTGKKFYPLTPREEDVDIVDIAHALSLICRFTGHCRVFYSVAEHSLRVSNILPPELQLAGLLHDAAEAYLADVARPAKLKVIEDIEERILKTIFSKYGVPYPLPDEVKEADWIMVATEGRDLMPDTRDWYLPLPPLKKKIRPMSSRTAEFLFLNRFAELKGENNES